MISNIAYFILLGKLLYSTAFQTDKSAQRGQKNTACAQVDFPVKKNLALKKSRWHWRFQVFFAAGRTDCSGMVFYLLMPVKLFDVSNK
ncbi:MAG: hypothetical protein WAO21_12120 [Verrucomicrobiia bacterium]